jgi:hypothetical protein
MRYRITIEDTRLQNRQSVVEVEADDLATALFMAGTEYSSVQYPEVIRVVKAEVPAGWVGVSLDG